MDSSSYFAASSFAETNMGLQLLKHQSLNNETFVVSPFLLIFTLLYGGYSNPSDLSDSESMSLVVSRMWRGGNVMDLFGASALSITPFADSYAPYTNIAFYSKWEYDNVTKMTIRNPVTIEMKAKEENEKISNFQEGRIYNLFKPDDFKDGGLVSMTLGYLKGTWKDPFNPTDTIKGVFHSSEVSKRNVEYMRANGVYRKYSENEDFQMLSLPYKPVRDFNNSVTFAINIFLPKNRFGLNKALETMNFCSFEDLLTNAHETFVQTTIPKFNIHTDFDSEAYYKRMGLEEILSKPTDDNVEWEKWDKYYRFKYEGGPEASRPKTFYRYQHKSEIGMDENGSNTGDIPEIPIKSAVVKVDHLKNVKKPKVFNADHPFVFVVTYGMHPVQVGAHY